MNSKLSIYNIYLFIHICIYYSILPFFLILDTYSIKPAVKMEQKKSNYDNLNVSFTRSVRGNNLLTINGKNYTLNRRIKDACYWECVKVRCKYTKCSARVITKYNRIASLRGQHNHN